MFCIYSSLETEFFPALRVFDGYVILAGAVNLQPDLCERLQNIGAIRDVPLFDSSLEIAVDGLLGRGPVILARYFPPAEQPSLVDIRVFRGMQAGAGRVVRSDPALSVIVEVADHVKMLLPAGRAGVERFTAGKLHTRNDEVQLVMACMRVPHPEDIALIRLQARKGDLFKIIHHPLLLFRRDLVVRVPGKHPSAEFPFGIQRVDEVAGGFHIPAQHFRLQFVPARIIRADKIMSRPVTAPLAMRKDFHIHGESSAADDSDGGDVSVLFSSRSRQISAASTSMTSARLLWIFTHRAS